MVMMIVPKFGLLLLLGGGPLATGLKFAPEQDTSVHLTANALKNQATGQVPEGFVPPPDFGTASNLDEIFDSAESEFVRAGGENDDEGGGWFGDFEAWMDQEHTDIKKVSGAHFSWVPYQQVGAGCTADGVGCVDGDTATASPAKTCMSTVSSERSNWVHTTNGGKMTNCMSMVVCPAGYHMTKCECKYSAGCAKGLAIAQKLEYQWFYVDRKDNNLGVVSFRRDGKGQTHQVMGRFGPSYWGYGSPGFGGHANGWCTSNCGTYNQNTTSEDRVSFTDDELTRGVCVGMQGPVPASVNAGSKTAVEATCQTTWRHKIVNTTDFDDSYGNMMNLNKNSQVNKQPKLKTAACPTGYKAVRCTCISLYQGCTDVTGTDLMETTDVYVSGSYTVDSGGNRVDKGACGSEGHHHACYHAVAKLWNNHPTSIIRDFSPKADEMTCEFQELFSQVKVYATCVHHENYSKLKNGIYRQVWKAANKRFGGETKARRRLRKYARRLRKSRFLR